LHNTYMCMHMCMHMTCTCACAHAHAHVQHVHTTCIPLTWVHTLHRGAASCTASCTRDPTLDEPRRRWRGEREGCIHGVYPRCTPGSGARPASILPLYYHTLILYYPYRRTPGRGARSERHSGTGAGSRARGGQPCHRGVRDVSAMGSAEEGEMEEMLAGYITIEAGSGVCVCV
jgi:hypothetical protein